MFLVIVRQNQNNRIVWQAEVAEATEISDEHERMADKAATKLVHDGNMSKGYYDLWLVRSLSPADVNIAAAIDTRIEVI